MRTAQPLRLEKVLELPVSTTAGGGRHWDVRMTVPRNCPDARAVQVMRPKVGDRLAGGGFVAVLRRWPEAGAGAEEGPETGPEVDEARGPECA